MVVYLSKPMIMTIKPYVEISRIRSITWWTCAKAKENNTMRHR
jgi:hypothetical protein